MYDTKLGQEYFVSALVWIPLSILLFYLFLEHQQRGRFPQNLIMFLLFLNCLTRCIWFFCYEDHGELLNFVILSRISIAIQFSAMTLLMLMWLRALKVSYLTDKLIQPKISNQLNQKNFSLASINNTLINLIAEDSHYEALSLLHNKEPISNNSFRNPSQNGPLSNNTDSNNLNLSTSYNLPYLPYTNSYTAAAIIINLIVYLILIVSLTFNGRGWYNLNIILISIISMVVSLVTLFIGIYTSLKLQRELAPVYFAGKKKVDPQADVSAVYTTQPKNPLHASSTSSSVDIEDQTDIRSSQISLSGSLDKESTFPQHPINTKQSHSLNNYLNDHMDEWQIKLSDCCQTVLNILGFSACYNIFKIFFDKETVTYGLKIQRDVLIVVLSVSFIIFVVFFIRAIGFLYRPFIVPVFLDDDGFVNSSDNFLYPFFFYQVPDLVCCLTIGWGISPPRGILPTFINYINVFKRDNPIRLCFLSYFCCYQIELYVSEEDDFSSSESEAKFSESTINTIHNAKLFNEEGEIVERNLNPQTPKRKKKPSKSIVSSYGESSILNNDQLDYLSNYGGSDDEDADLEAIMNDEIEEGAFSSISSRTSIDENKSSLSSYKYSENSIYSSFSVSKKSEASNTKFSIFGGKNNKKDENDYIEDNDYSIEYTQQSNIFKNIENKKKKQKEKEKGNQSSTFNIFSWFKKPDPAKTKSYAEAKRKNDMRLRIKSTGSYRRNISTASNLIPIEHLEQIARENEQYEELLYKISSFNSSSNPSNATSTSFNSLSSSLNSVRDNNSNKSRVNSTTTPALTSSNLRAISTSSITFEPRQFSAISYNSQLSLSLQNEARTDSSCSPSSSNSPTRITSEDSHVIAQKNAQDNSQLYSDIPNRKGVLKWN